MFGAPTSCDLPVIITFDCFLIFQNLFVFVSFLLVAFDHKYYQNILEITYSWRLDWN